MAGRSSQRRSDRTAAERRRTDETRREKLRGGLAALHTAAAKTCIQKADSPWKVLAAEPFAVSKIAGLLRSRSPRKWRTFLTSFGTVASSRLDRGDEAVSPHESSELANGQSSTVNDCVFHDAPKKTLAASTMRIDRSLMVCYDDYRSQSVEHGQPIGKSMCLHWPT